MPAVRTAPSLCLVCRDSGERLIFSDPERYAHILAVAARQGIRLDGREFDLSARDAPLCPRQTAV